MNRQEFSDKVMETKDSLYRVAKSIVLCQGDCEDAVSQAVLRAWEKLDSLKQEEYFQTWLIRILIHECYRMRRERQRFLSWEEWTPENQTSGRGNPEELDLDLQKAVLKLPLKIRTAVVLYYMEEYPVSEISQIMKIPPGTVKSRLARGRKLLAEYLGDP